MAEDNIVNLHRRRNDLFEAEIDAEVKSIMDDLILGLQARCRLITCCSNGDKRNERR